MFQICKQQMIYLPAQFGPWHDINVIVSEKNIVGNWYFVSSGFHLLSDMCVWSSIAHYQIALNVSWQPAVSAVWTWQKASNLLVCINCSCLQLTGSFTVGHNLANIGVLVTRTTGHTKVIHSASFVTIASSTTMTFCAISENSTSTVTSARRTASPMSISGIERWRFIYCRFFWRFTHWSHNRSLADSHTFQYCSVIQKVDSSVVESRWLCYFQESRSTCQKSYFLESRSIVKIFYSLESRKWFQKCTWVSRSRK